MGELEGFQRLRGVVDGILGECWWEWIDCVEQWYDIEWIIGLRVDCVGFGFGRVIGIGVGDGGIDELGCWRELVPVCGIDHGRQQYGWCGECGEWWGLGIIIGLVGCAKCERIDGRCEWLGSVEQWYGGRGQQWFGVVGIGIIGGW